MSGGSKSVYILDSRKLKPTRRPSVPFGPSGLEILRSCGLRACYEASPNFERRIGFAARVGTAFHQTLQSFGEHPLPTDDLANAIGESRSRFDRFLSEQLNESKDHPREVGLPRPNERVDKAIEAVVAEARRIVEKPERNTLAWSNRSSRTIIEQIDLHESFDIELEVPVASKDGRLKGRIDRIEVGDPGVVLFDFKSAIRDDLPERYERQLQIYAFLFHETRGFWPTKAFVNYPLKGTSHEVDISQDKCQNVARASIDLIEATESQPMYKLARPGEVCQVCDFRPWCAAFWRFQAEQTASKALESSSIGLLGILERIESINTNWKLSIKWRQSVVTVTVPKERFPFLSIKHLGKEVRLLDHRLHGLRHSPRAVINQTTELFIVE